MSAATALLLVTAGVVLTGGPADARTTPGGNISTASPATDPQVVLTSPTDGSHLVSVCAVRLSADASVPSGTIDRVEFHLNNQLVGSDASAPYETQVPPDHPALRGSSASGLRHTAYARVVTPTATADSTLVHFGQAPIPPALMVIACPSRAQVAEGSTTTMTFVTVCLGTPGLNLTVTGDTGVSVTPTVLPPGHRENSVTVVAAPGSAGATARVTARADAANCMPGSASVTVGS
ncbi:Ig-like domain-containing protein [Plantactinospora sonchi]|uniref:Ig-like domain-containing protein n=1 Tax=Plantactinospora sonchi TaxID=1544735 RepID=A0ABU7RMD3_9ACTN